MQIFTRTMALLAVVAALAVAGVTPWSGAPGPVEAGGSWSA